MELSPDDRLLAEDREEASNPCIPHEFLEAATLAMRLAITHEGAPARCHRKACRRQGRCHFSIDAEGDGVCPGGISPAAVDKAALMLAFLAALWRDRVGAEAGFAFLELADEMVQMATERNPSLRASVLRRRKGRPRT